MLALMRLFDLDVSAASGLVRRGRELFVVADDELFLDRYSLDSGTRTGRIALPLGPPLPDDERARKKSKADLESLVALPDGSLLALGSGSAAGRARGVVLEAMRPRVVDLGPLYDALAKELGTPNVEGAAVAGDVLRLLHRGNGAGAENALVDLDLAATRSALAQGELTPALVREVRRVSLGTLDGVPLGFTDASPIPGSSRLAFVAAAEDTENPYEDGACAGSVVGVVEADGRVEVVERFEGARKLEGLAVDADEILVVDDPDSRDVRAALWRASRPGGM